MSWSAWGIEGSDVELVKKECVNHVAYSVIGILAPSGTMGIKVATNYVRVG